MLDERFAEWLEVLAPTFVYIFIDIKARRHLKEDIKVEFLNNIKNNNQYQKEKLDSDLESILIMQFEKFTYEAAAPVTVINFLILWIKDAFEVGLITLIAGLVYVVVSNLKKTSLEDDYIQNESITRSFAWLAFGNIVLQAVSIILIKGEFLNKETVMFIYVIFLAILSIPAIVNMIRPYKIWK